MSEDRLLAYDSQWILRKEEIELTGPELGQEAWATVTKAKFRGEQVALKKYIMFLTLITIPSYFTE